MFLRIFISITCIFFASFKFAIFASSGYDLSADFVEYERSFSDRGRVDMLPEAHAKFAIIAERIFEKGALEETDAETLIRILTIDPEAKTPLAMLMAYRIGKDEVQKFLDEILPILDRDPANDAIALAVAFALARLEQTDRALDIIERTLDALAEKKGYEYGRNFEELVIYLSELYIKKEKWEKGEKLFERVLRIESLKDSFKLHRAAFLFFSRKAEDKEFSLFSGWQERRFYRKMRESFSHLERIWMEQIENKEADSIENIRAIEFTPIIEACKKFGLIERIENLLLEKSLDSPDNLETKLILAALFYDLGNYASSRRLWKIICMKAKDNYRFFAEYGRAAMMSRKYDEAIRALEWAEFISTPQEKANLQFVTAIAYMNAQNYEKAIAKFEKLKKNPEAHYYIAVCWKKLGNNVKAAEALDLAEKVALEIQNYEFLGKDFYLYSAFVNERAKRRDRVVEILKTAYEKYPNDHEVCNFLGYTLADYNMELELSEKALNKALEIEPNNGAYLDSMAWLLYRKGDYHGAYEYIMKSIDNLKDGPDPVVYDHAGDIVYALGRKEEAINYWKIAVEIYSEDTDREKIREKIINAGGKYE